MRKITIFFIAAFALASTSYGEAALVFNADFVRDGKYDSSWPMKAGDAVVVDIYVSNVLAPGLISMGFKLSYDSAKLEVVTADTSVETVNWPISYLMTDTPGEIDMAGFRLEGLAANNIRLGTVAFRCKSEGTSEITLLDREGDWFVLDSEEQIILDGDIGTGVLLSTIQPPILGDVNGDGLANLADAIIVLKVMVQRAQVEVVQMTGDVNG
ncbi:MAG: hypothetical protein LUQ37_00820, partial [Methanoregulaceae archaeon]|nr:hypothetical protein [Methanoregulaceae archaeon]